MTARGVQRWVAPILLAALLMVVATTMQARAQGTDDLDALNKQAMALYKQGKYAEATEIAKGSLRLRRCGVALVEDGARAACGPADVEWLLSEHLGIDLRCSPRSSTSRD